MMPGSDTSSGASNAPHRERHDVEREPTVGTPYGLAYYRVSTSDQANTSFDDDGFSIQAQREYCQRKAAELGVQLVDEYVDRGKSARSADRPALQSMLARIKEDTDIQYVFVHKLDRLARNREDDVQIGLLLAKNGVRLVSCTENIDDTPSGRLVHGIMADIAEWYSANLSEEAKKGMRKKVESGGTPGNVPIGYENVRLKITELGKDIGVVQVHELFAPIVTECFKLYDTGLYTLTDIATYANEHGLRLRANKRLPERPLRTQTMHRLLRNRYYTGWVKFSGVDYRGDHTPLIDDATFDRVQALLTARDTTRDKSQKRPHHLKGSIFCAYCGRRFGITVATKRRNGATYPYFYCLGRQLDKNHCPQGYIAIDAVVSAVRAYWPRVHIPDERIRALREAILGTFTGKQERGYLEIETQKRRLIELEQQRQKAKAAYYANVLDLDEFKSEQEVIKQGVRAAKEIIAHWSVELTSITQSLDDALRLVDDPQALYDALPERLKLLFVQTVFEKIWIMDNRVVGSDLTQPFAELMAFEARLALAEPRNAEPSDRDVTTEAETTVDTYHRQRTPLTSPNSAAGTWSVWLPVERPHGSLAIDRQNPGLSGSRGSNLKHMVGLTGFKLNTQLALYLRKHPNAHKRRLTPAPSPLSYHACHWRIRNRLSNQEITELITAFKAGTPKHELAKRYGVALGSLKKLLREEGVKRKSWKDRQK